MKQTAAATQQVEWANPGALGLGAFGFTTLLLQLHNLGLISSTMPLAFGFFWGGLAQVIAGVIDGRRGDTFGLTAFTSYGVFWIGLAFSLFIQIPLPNGIGPVVTIAPVDYAWVMIMWGIFTLFMSVGTFKMTVVHAIVFVSLTVLFFLLAAHFFGVLNAKIAGAEGIIVGAAAVYGSAAVVLNNKYGRVILPMGVLSK